MTITPHHLDILWRNWVSTDDPQVRAFCADLYRNAQPPIMAQDAALTGETTMPSTRSGNMLRGYGDRRGARDQISRNDLGTRPDELIDGEDQDPNNGPIDAESCARFVEILANGLAKRDAEDESGESGESGEHNRFMQFLGQLVAAHHDNMNGNNNRNGDKSFMRNAGSPSGFNGRGGMDRRRARDQAPPTSQTSSLFTGTEAADRRRARDRHPAQDSAIGSINMSDFASRFPDAMKISVRG
jgi:hypothetical protein